MGKTYLFSKPTDTHQLLDPIFSQPYLCKKGILYSQSLFGKMDNGKRFQRENDT